MRLFCILAMFFVAGSVRAQFPVIDAAAIAKAVSMIAHLQEQVQLIRQELKTAREIRGISTEHLHRYERALAKRGLVSSQPLDATTEAVEGHLFEAPGYLSPAATDALYLFYDMPPDPLDYNRKVVTRSAATMQQTLQALAANGQQIRRSHDELERFKREINRNLEPQQMRDVQASLQVLSAREALLTRQALMTLTNMEAIRAVERLNEKGQRRALYDTFVGKPHWRGDPRQYSVKSFLRMPNQ